MEKRNVQKKFPKFSYILSLGSCFLEVPVSLGSLCFIKHLLPCRVSSTTRSAEHKIVPWIIIPFISFTHFLEVKSSLGRIPFVGANWLIVAGKTTFISSCFSVRSVAAATTPGFPLVLPWRRPMVPHCEPPVKGYRLQCVGSRYFYRSICFPLHTSSGSKAHKVYW